MSEPERLSLLVDRTENTNLTEDVDLKLLFKFRQNLCLRGNTFDNQMPGMPLLLTGRPENIKTRHLFLVKGSQIPFSGCRGEVENVSATIRGQGSHFR